MGNNRNNTALIKQYKSGDNSAFDELINANMGLVISTARRFMNRGTEYEDLVQIGSIGLIKAANSFDPELGYEFSTYAFSMITGEIRRHLRDDGLIRVSRSIKKKCAELLKIREEYLFEFNIEPTISYLSERCGISKEEAVICLGAMSPIESMNSSENGEMPLENKTGTDNIGEFIEKFSLTQALDKLSDEERLIIHLRYDLSMTQCDVATRLGASQVKISRMEKKIIEKLRKTLIT
ncbi:MAG: sigma-70 family RNA polymerase sigma factor [Clostridia bacterium]|nr:sigma-70 family RNA polymerase sigma factor [Clostridia bacterium]